jgi:RimJ/RimL family protein N-acetyltransferase
MNMDHEIKTDRLLLHPLSEADIGFIKELAARPESYRYESDGPKTDEEIDKQCHRFIERAQTLPEEGAIRWIVKYLDKSIGEVNVRCNWEETFEWEIGYSLLSEYWGNGFASEAVRAVIHYAFTHFKINRLAAFLNAENKRSAALLERIGMIQEGRLREVRLINGIYNDEYVFSVLSRELNHT